MKKDRKSHHECFICNGPHKHHYCLRKERLNVTRKNTKPSDEEEVEPSRVTLIQVLGATKVTKSVLMSGLVYVSDCFNWKSGTVDTRVSHFFCLGTIVEKITFKVKKYLTHVNS